MRLTIRCVVLLFLCVYSSFGWSGEKGEIGLGLKREGLAWRVIRISRDGQAAKAGLKVGDVVVQINNLFLPSEEQLSATVAGLKPGDVVEVSVLSRLGGYVLHKITAATASR
jgi:S1-C subfamily serine protease